MTRSPLEMDQPLVNPGAGGKRLHQSIAPRLRFQREQTFYQTSFKSSVDSVLDIWSLENQAVLKAGMFFGELNIKPQLGRKRTTTSFSEEGVAAEHRGSVDNKLLLNSIQGIVGGRVAPYLDVGFKVLSAAAQFETNNKFRYFSGATQFVTSDIDSEQSLSYFSWGPGGVVRLPSGYLELGYGVDFVNFTSDVEGKGKYKSESSSFNSSSSSSFRHKKDSRSTRIYYGLGGVYNWQQNQVRIELNEEKSAPFDTALGVADGRKTAVVIEALWGIFQLGGTVTKVKGFYVDPLNLVPYFFYQDTFSNAERQEQGGWGGLRSAKGHGVGVSYFQSKGTTKESLSSIDDVEYDLSRKAYSVSVSYSYRF